MGGVIGPCVSGPAGSANPCIWSASIPTGATSANAMALVATYAVAARSAAPPTQLGSGAHCSTEEGPTIKEGPLLPKSDPPAKEDSTRAKEHPTIQEHPT